MSDEKGQGAITAELEFYSANQEKPLRISSRIKWPGLNFSKVT